MESLSHWVRTNVNGVDDDETIFDAETKSSSSSIKINAFSWLWSTTVRWNFAQALWKISRRRFPTRKNETNCCEEDVSSIQSINNWKYTRHNEQVSIEMKSIIIGHWPMSTDVARIVLRKSNDHRSIQTWFTMISMYKKWDHEILIIVLIKSESIIPWDKMKLFTSIFRRKKTEFVTTTYKHKTWNIQIYLQRGNQRETSLISKFTVDSFHLRLNEKIVLIEFQFEYCFWITFVKIFTEFLNHVFLQEVKATVLIKHFFETFTCICFSEARSAIAQVEGYESSLRQ